MKSKIIAISAISAGLVAICLIIGAYLQFTDLFMLVLSSVFVMLPLYRKSYLGCVLTFLVGGAVAFICALPTITFTVVFPAYVVFFGLYPIVRHKLNEKNFPNFATIIIGLVWCVLTVYGSYFYYTLVMGFTLESLPIFVVKYIYVFIGLIGVVFYFVFDRYVIVIKRFLDKYLQKIIK